MKKRSLLTSVVASSVLVGVLAMSGCGGSNDSSVGNGPASQVMDYVAESKTTQTITSGSDGEILLEGATSDGKKVQTAKIRFKSGLAGCTDTTPCEVVAEQKSATVLDAVTKAEAANIADLVPTATDKTDVLFAGSLDIEDKNSGLATKALGTKVLKGKVSAACEMEVTIKLPAKARGLDGKERNIWNCDIMQIHVQTPGATPYWVKGDLIVDDHQGCGVKDKYVTFIVKGGLPAHILIFAVTDKAEREKADDAVATGMSSSGAGSY